MLKDKRGKSKVMIMQKQNENESKILTSALKGN